MPRTRPERDALRSQQPGKRQPAVIHDLIWLPLERRRHATICAKSAARITASSREPQGATGSVTYVQYQLLQGAGGAAHAGDDRLRFWAAAELADPARQS